VQTRVEVAPYFNGTRCGLALVWEDEEDIVAMAFAGLKFQQDTFYYGLYYPHESPPDALRWDWYGGNSEINDSNPGLMHELNGVRVELTPTEIVFSSSSDGETWHVDRQLTRPAAMSGPPSTLRLGANPDGEDAPFGGALDVLYFDDLVVGTEESSAGAPFPVG